MAETLATFSTSQGKFVIRLFPELAPNTVANFVELAEGTREWTHPATGVKSKTPLYNGTIFHRIIDNFMIQGGDPLGKGVGGPGYDFDDEIHAQNKFDRPYLLAMANAGKRMGKGTNGSQFFITTVPTPWLNDGHTLFGEVVEGQDVVAALGKVPTAAGDKPLTDVVLESVTIERR
ncbi:peptidyl-prolyl cis-trans isomerase A (cyclophilin A) [Actinocorallia herbida]|uniref:Peptidyl-prolyl cis-trans isomerase n=1 Tax=Actinocorallia herbida TaxID=58109 RepID=A0A3N1DAZ3_9ACTN|nr:peptidylprolyl isomerase [Actinocorallia herbida]ROO90684.1 peptidyl-prolyl cis-trans isomerase A (cyclophilin A) [Actinocorallia herbida]